MTQKAHYTYIIFFFSLILVSTIVIISVGFDYYNTPLSERFFHGDHSVLKPSGSIGHGYGIIGSALMLIGVLIYIIRKRSRKLSRFGLLKHWLELHIFLCTLGPILVLFHTAFKFGGIVSVSFWSMIAVVLSGVIGRFIYLQIPRSMDGVELSFEQSSKLNFDLNYRLRKEYNLNSEFIEKIEQYSNHSTKINVINLIPIIVRGFWEDRNNLKKITNELKQNKIPKPIIKEVKLVCKSKLKLNRRLTLLKTTQQLFGYWHIAHFPFAILMLIIMIVHIIVAITFGYKWIF